MGEDLIKKTAPSKLEISLNKLLNVFRGISSGTCCTNTLSSENLLLGLEMPVLSRVFLSSAHAVNLALASISQNKLTKPAPYK